MTIAFALSVKSVGDAFVGLSDATSRNDCSKVPATALTYVSMPTLCASSNRDVV